MIFTAYIREQRSLYLFLFSIIIADNKFMHWKRQHERNFKSWPSHGHSAPVLRRDPERDIVWNNGGSPRVRCWGNYCKIQSQNSKHQICGLRFPTHDLEEQIKIVYMRDSHCLEINLPLVFMTCRQTEQILCCGAITLYVFLRYNLLQWYIWLDNICDYTKRPRVETVDTNVRMNSFVNLKSSNFKVPWSISRWYADKLKEARVYIEI